jgi:hypothetical protein
MGVVVVVVLMLVVLVEMVLVEEDPFLDPFSFPLLFLLVRECNDLLATVCNDLMDRIDLLDLDRDTAVPTLVSDGLTPEEEEDNSESDDTGSVFSDSLGSIRSVLVASFTLIIFFLGSSSCFFFFFL